MPSASFEPANKGQRYPAEILTEDEVRALLKSCSTRAPTGVRNSALIVALYRGGLRISEALALRPKTSIERPAPCGCSKARADEIGRSGSTQRPSR